MFAARMDSDSHRPIERMQNTTLLNQEQRIRRTVLVSSVDLDLSMMVDSPFKQQLCMACVTARLSTQHCTSCISHMSLTKQALYAFLMPECPTDDNANLIWFQASAADTFLGDRTLPALEHSKRDDALLSIEKFTATALAAGGMPRQIVNHDRSLEHRCVTFGAYNFHAPIVTRSAHESAIVGRPVLVRYCAGTDFAFRTRARMAVITPAFPEESFWRRLQRHHRLPTRKALRKKFRVFLKAPRAVWELIKPEHLSAARQICFAAFDAFET
jgi:hypothetical protein